MTISDDIVTGILIAGVIYSLARKKLTIPATLTGALLGWMIYAGGGFTALLMMTVFFILGTAATSWKKAQKSGIRTNAAHQTTRSTSQVIANAGVAGIAGLLHWVLKGHQSLLLLAMAGCFAAAAADTISSELGMVYGRRFFNVMTGRQDQRGLDGVISIEGLLVGTAAAAVIALIFMIGRGWNTWLFAIIVLAGTVGNLVDSILGATLERKRRLNNDMVNFLSTLAGALFACWASYGYAFQTS